jgi:hypothetical protein
VDHPTVTAVDLLTRAGAIQLEHLICELRTEDLQTVLSRLLAVAMAVSDELDRRTIV